MINGKVLAWIIGLGMIAFAVIFPFVFRSEDSYNARLARQFGVAQIKGIRHFSSQELDDARSSLSSVDYKVNPNERMAVIVRINPAENSGANCPAFWGDCWTALIVFGDDGSHVVVNAYGSNLAYFDRCFKEGDRIAIIWDKVRTTQQNNIGDTHWVRKLDSSSVC